LLSEGHLESLFKARKDHQKRGILHSSLGPEIPDAHTGLPIAVPSRHEISLDQEVVAKGVLGDS
jgi:hypothetical protein